jgi:hypothetical protein
MVVVMDSRCGGDGRGRWGGSWGRGINDEREANTGLMIVIVGEGVWEEEAGSWEE